MHNIIKGRISNLAATNPPAFGGGGGGGGRQAIVVGFASAVYADMTRAHQQAAVGPVYVNEK